MRISNLKFRTTSGFSLVEMVIGASVFAVIAMSVFQSYSSLISLVAIGKFKIMATDVANAEFELLRNVPYADVGLINGIPVGTLPATSTVSYNNYTFDITRTIRNVDDPYDGTIGGSPNDLSPADYKMVGIDVSCGNCKNFEPIQITSRVSPKNLETASTNGALFIRVFDANGNPVSDADVSVVKSGSPPVSINDVTDLNGLLAIVDAPPAINGYRITVTKPGYTVDRTYATSSSNPNPTKPDATVIIQQVTQVSFIIDLVSEVNISTKDNQCVMIGNVPFNIMGSKLIGINPDVLKFPSTNYSTDSSGNKTIGNLEWDTFILSVSTGGFFLAGMNPIMPFAVLPDSSQNIDLILTNAPADHLLVTVKDAATQLPISGADLILDDGITPLNLITGRGYLEQSDWSGGAGQTNFVDPLRYSSQDGNIETNSPSGEIKLMSSLGHYANSGTLTSSVFDSGSSSNFSNIFWSPTAQPPQTGGENVKFQIATSIDNTATTTWNYLGPDGTNASFYSTYNANINPIHNGDRYFRYKIFLNTPDDNFTPNIASIAVTFTSNCIPPGQAIFSNLSAGNYNLTVSKSGYSTQIVPININLSWDSVDINLLP